MRDWVYVLACYLLRQIGPLVRAGATRGRGEPAEGALAEWRGRLSVRSRSMLAAAAELSTYLADRGHLPPT